MTFRTFNGQIATAATPGSQGSYNLTVHRQTTLHVPTAPTEVGLSLVLSSLALCWAVVGYAGTGLVVLWLNGAAEAPYYLLATVVWASAVTFACLGWLRSSAIAIRSLRLAAAFSLLASAVLLLPGMGLRAPSDALVALTMTALLFVSSASIRPPSQFATRFPRSAPFSGGVRMRHD